MDFIGKQLGGCRIDRKLGQGGMGTVFLATQLSLDRQVAIKVLAQNLASNEEFRERFKREARSIAKVNHPNILQVYEVGETEGVHFMVMEFIDGENIAARLDRDGFIPWREAAQIVTQAAEGLQKAAEVNIMHRDIKPDNLMITRSGQVKVSDFGLAKQAQVELTQTNTVMGTPAYMSPEQCDGDNLDTRTDIYSLGATFYRMVTGVLPFNAPSPMAIMYKHKHETPTPPQRYMPGIPEDVSAVILRMMEKDRNKRYAAMSAVAEALGRCLARNPAQPGSSSSAAMTLKIDVKGGFDFDAPAAPPRSTRTSAVVRRDSGVLKNVDDLVREGDALMKDGHPSAAMGVWRQALAMQPDNPDLKSRIEHSTGESQRFSKQLADDLLRQGNLADLRRNLFERITRDGNDIPAREQLQALDDLERHKRDMVNKIRTLLGNNEYDQALAIWDGLHPELREPAMEKTILHVRTVVQPLLKLVNEARVHAEGGNYESALALYERAAALDPNHELVRLGLRDTKHSLDRLEQYIRDAYEAGIDGRHDEAVALCRKALELSPGHTKARAFAIEHAVAIADQADRKSDLATAQAAWTAVLAFDRNHATGRERAADLHTRLATVNELFIQAQKFNRTRKYGRAVTLFSRALAMDPENRKLRFGLDEARRNRFYRRRLPAVAIVLAGVLGALAWLWLAFDRLDREAAHLYAQGDYAAATGAWRGAEATPLWGAIAAPRIKTDIRRAELFGRLAEAEKMTAYGDFRTAAVALEKDLAAAQDFPEKPRMRVRLTLAEAALLYAASDAEGALAAYHRAQAAVQEAHAELPGGIAARMEGLAAYVAGLRAEEASTPRQALMHFETAVQTLPDFADAARRRDRLATAVAGAQNYASQAREAMRKGCNTTVWDDARAQWADAQAKARQALEADPGNPDMRAILLEIQWRLDAGPDMVYFKLDDTSAFAIDRYEYPNRKGVVPERATFFDARARAAAAGKALPSRAEWEYAARGGKDSRRRFPYGNEFSAAASCNSVGTAERLAPEPAGSYPAGNTPEGVADLTGNVAEWIDSGETKSTPVAVAFGGHFANRQESDLACDAAKQYRTDMVDSHVGFRCVRRYSPKTHPLATDAAPKTGP